jgi:hypothetical protein
MKAVDLSLEKVKKDYKFKLEETLNLNYGVKKAYQTMDV